MTIWDLPTAIELLACRSNASPSQRAAAATVSGIKSSPICSAQRLCVLRTLAEPVLTNCVFGAYAAGDLEGVDDVKAALGSVIKRSGVYKPEAALTRRYRELFETVKSSFAKI